MTTRRRGDRQWRNMAEMLHRHVQPLRITLDAAQQLVDAVPDEPLPAAWVQAIVVQTLARWSETRLACIPSGASELLFRAETWASPAAGLIDLPRLIGIDARPNLGVVMTRIESDVVDVAGLLGRPARWRDETLVGPADSIVVEVALDCRNLERSPAGAIRQCAWRWDACLQAEAVDAHQVSSQCEAWRDGVALENLAAAQRERHGSSTSGTW